MLSHPIDLCAYAYLEYYRSHFKAYAWAYDRAELLILTRPSEGLVLIMDILHLCRNEEEIAYVASGLLEELLHQHIEEIAKSIAGLLNHSPLLRKAMKYVWVPEGSNLQNILLLATGKTSANFITPHEPPPSESKVVDE